MDKHQNEKMENGIPGGDKNLKAEVAVVEKTVTEEVKLTVEGNDLEDQKRYEEALKKYDEGIAQIKAFNVELKGLFQRSQDHFERQLSYISAGALALSVGFIKDIVTPIKDSTFKWMLVAGWGLLIFTLLLNLISHLVAVKYAKKGAKETDDIESSYDPVKIDKRSKRMSRINWTTVMTLAGGIILIVIYITINSIYDR